MPAPSPDTRRLVELGPEAVQSEQPFQRTATTAQCQVVPVCSTGSAATSSSTVSLATPVILASSPTASPLVVDLQYLLKFGTGLNT